MMAILFIIGLIVLLVYVSKKDMLGIDRFNTLLSIAEGLCPMCGIKLHHKVSRDNNIISSETLKETDCFMWSFCVNCKFKTDIKQNDAIKITDKSERYYGDKCINE
jgi:hypothetical protein